ncbi:MAG: DUF6787 family protein, partial [Aquaticitalea sp.]
MKNFKERWQIQHNWELVFPLLGVFALLYLAYKLSKIFMGSFHIIFILLVTLIFYFFLLKFFLWCFKKLENKWVVIHRWEMIRIFFVFAITGSLSVFIGKPIIAYIGITKENLNPFVYWVLYGIIALVFYQILLVCLGWIFGQFQFF